MENTRPLRFIQVTIIGVLLLSAPLFVYAYSQNTTHPALTQEVIKLYNQKVPDQKISQEDEEKIIQGSIDEDAFGRWMRHYYDPVHNKGVRYLGVDWETSKDWAGDTIAQATYKIQDTGQSTLYGRIKDWFSGETDYSWERAIYEYTWGNKKRGLETLGHILHLVEDASVPDHTRNDPHPALGELLENNFPQLASKQVVSFLDRQNATDASPYESWTKKFSRESFAVSLKDENMPLLADLSAYLDSLAKYSNNNFFSRDTIFIKDYNQPIITEKGIEQLSDGQLYQFGYGDINNEKIKLVLLGKRILGTTEKSNSIEDVDKTILSDYWSHLSKQAVLHGAGAVKLFFDEVAREKQTKTLYRKNRSWLTQKMDVFKNGVFNIAGALYGISVNQKDLEADPAEPVPATNSEVKPSVETEKPASEISPADTAAKTEEKQPFQIYESLAKNISPDEDKKPAQSGVEKSSPVLKSASPPTFVSSNTSSFMPFPGAAGPPPASTPSASDSTSSSSSPPPAPSPDTTPPSAPIITSPASDNLIFTSADLSFSGTAEASSTISQDFSDLTASVTGAGDWILQLTNLLQGTSTIKFFAKDSAGNQSASSTRAVFIDSTAPDAAIAVSQCDNSLSPDSCLIATSTVSVAWSSGAADLDHYIVECESGGASCAGFPDFSTTTSTSTIYTLPTDNSSYIFKVKSSDTHGNQSAQATKTVEIFSRPVVINEIAWAGTSSSRSEDEWIELYNTTSKTINLSGMTLVSETDSGPNLNLTGTLSPGGYYLIERTDDTTISDIIANQFGSFGNGLSNSGEVLALKMGSTTLDKTPLVSACNGWCGGAGSPQYWTMERYDFTASGEATSSWGSFAGFLANGKNADNASISGTPGRRNSMNYLIASNGTYLGQSKTLKVSNSPYVVTAGLTVASGATLTVEPGTVIKFYNQNSSLTVNGILNAQGTASAPIIFTSFNDDSYAGDTNQDGSTTSPQAGDWSAIKIKSDGSVLDRTIVRYGGNADISSATANVRVENASFSLKNSTLEEAGAFGLKLVNATGTVEANIFRNNNHNAVGAGAVANKGSVTFLNNTFSGNTSGIITFKDTAADTDSFTITGNTFSQNSGYAVQSVSAFPSLSGNTATGNGYNGINIQGNFLQDHTLSANLPYIIVTTVNVPAGKILTIPAGAVIKFGDNGSLVSSGKIMANGADDAKIIFTSLKDDEYGGDTNGDAAATSPAPGDWLNISFASGSASSTLNNIAVRYGGAGGTSYGGLKISDVSIDIANSTIEKNDVFGIRLSNSTSTSITGGLIQNHQTPAPNFGTGIFLENSSALFLQNTTFKNNRTGIAASLSSVTNGGGIIFENNTTDFTPPNLISP